MKHLLTKILMVGVFASLITAQTDVGGVISSNTTWSSNVNITGDILVSSGVTLTIESGVTVAFQGEYYLQVEGSLVADGNASSRIKFSNNTDTPAGGYWQHIYFKSNSTGGSLTYCDFQYGGAASYVIKSETTAVISITHNTFDQFGEAQENAMIPGGTLIYSSTSALIIIEYNLFTMHSTYSDMMNTWGGWTAVSGSGMTVFKNIFIKGDHLSEPTGLSLRSSTITNNVFVNIDFPINCRYSYGSGGESTVSNNIIINADEKAISITGSPTITYNTIVSSELAISIPHETTAFSYSPVINYNNIYDNTKNVDVSMTRTEQPDPINAENNYWGTINTSEIAALITDYNDDFNITEIDYDPYLTSPNTTAPISPPRNVTVSNASGNYILSWTGSPESDISGYKVYYGGYTGYSFSNVITFGMVAQYDMTAAGLESYLDSVIAVTAYDNNADGTDDQVEGYESWFSIVPYTGPVWYVSKSGSDNNDGSEDAPFITIQKGIDSASSGDTIRVGAHIIDPAPTSSHYYSKITITDKNLTILSDSGADSTKISGGGTGRPVTITGTSAVTLKGFSITNGLADNGGGINISSTGSILLENLYIYSNQATSDGGGIYTADNSNVTINACKIYQNVCAGHGGGITNIDSIVINNTLIYNNEAQTDGGGIYADDVLILTNSTLAYNFTNDGRYGPAIDIKTGLDSLLLLNNIFYQNYRGQNFTSGEEGIFIWDGRLVAYNNYFQEGESGLNISRGSGNIFSDTQPVISPTSASDDYSLKNTSSAIGAGISSVTLNGTTYSAPTTDYIDAARPQPSGTNPDMGAIENSLGVASAKTITVCHSPGTPHCYGDDLIDYGEYSNIQSAIDVANDGDTVLVYPGTYTENINYNGKNIVVQGADRETTIIDGNQSGSVVTFENGETNNALLIDFTITNGSGSLDWAGGTAGAGIYVYNSSPILNNLIIANNKTIEGENHGHGGGIVVIGDLNNQKCYLYNSIIKDNEAMRGAGFGIITWGNGGALIMENCLVINNKSKAWGAAGNIEGEIHLINVTIANNSNVFGSDVGVLFFTDGSDFAIATITNTIIYNNDISISPLMLDLYKSTGNSIEVNFSNIQSGFEGIGYTSNNLGAITNWGASNIDSNPYFIDATNGNYRLSGYSPCIGAGTATGAPTTDIEGNPRPNPAGSNPDIGAYENALGVAIAIPAIVVCGDIVDPVCMGLNNPYHNIQSAINASEHGDTILVYPGTFYENINFNGKNIVVGSLYLTSQDSSYISNTIIDGFANGIPVVRFQNAETNDAKLIGFTIQNGFTATDELGAGIDISGNAEPTLDHLIIQNNNAQSGRGGGIRFYFAGTSSILSNLTIRNNISSDMGGGIYSWQSFIDLSNSKIYGNSSEYGSGLSFHGSQGGNNGKPILNSQISNNVGAPVIDGSDIVLVNCSIINNDGLLELYGNSALINTIVGSGHTIDDNGILNISYSLIQDGISSIDYPFEASLVWGEGNIEADPLFIAPDNGDYHLQLNSPAIDAGHPDLDGDGITWETDIDDQDPDGSRMDMGYASTSCLVDQCGICDYDTSNDCTQDCAGEWGGTLVEDTCGNCPGEGVPDCAGECGGTAVIDGCGVCNGNNANMNECGVCYALYSCNPFVLSNETDTISLKTDTLTFTFSVPMDTLKFSAISLTSIEIDNIEFHTSQDADSIRTLTLIIDSPLVSRDTLTLTFPSTLHSSFGFPFDGNQDGTTGDGQTITLYTETLADYNHDNAIDFDDMTTFIASWYADDYDKELGPVTGTAPHLIPTFDNAFDIEDIITFMLMWNWANDFIPTPTGRIKDSGIPPNIILQDGILQLDLSDYLENIAAVRIQLSTSDPKVKVVSEGIQSPFDITLLRSWEEDNIYEWNFGNPQGKHFDVVQLCHLETMQKQNLHLVIDYEIISTHGNVLSSGRTALDHIVIPNEYALQQAYPNPFNPVTTLSFGLPIETEVSLSVYNLQGKEVISLIDGNLDVGYHSVVWNADRHSSGVYFVKMIAGEYVNTQKLMLIK